MKLNSSSTSFTFGCFSGFLSKILCSKIQPEFKTCQHFSTIEKIIDGSATPNLVARLMGLEFMPEKEFNSIYRSKSMDSEENRVKTEDIQIHRRVKTSFSIKETPNYFEIEDDNFFVLSFENNNGKKITKGVNYGKSNEGKKYRKCRRKQSKNRVVFSDEERVNLKILPQICQDFDNGFEVSNESYRLLPNKDKNLDVKNSEIECELENYSPISVLDDSEFVSETEVTFSSFSEEDTRSRGSEYDSKESSSTSSNDSFKVDEEQTKVNEGKKDGLKRREYNKYKKQENIEIMSKVFKLAEEDFNNNNNNNTNWKYKGIFTAQEFEQTRLNLSHLIFDHLISELVHQLLGL